MTNLLGQEMSKSNQFNALGEIAESAERRMQDLRSLKVSIDMSRGVLSSEQLALSDELFDSSLVLPPVSLNGVDCRNYGGQTGIDEARLLCAPLLGVPVEQTIVYGNSRAFSAQNESPGIPKVVVI